MDRKDFLALTIPLYSVLHSGKAGDTGTRHHLQIPPYLEKGDTVGITCPSGFISAEDIQPAVNKLKEWGFNVVVGKTVGAKEFTLAGSDAERTNDMQSMLDDNHIKAILLGRGGYGAVRIIDQLNFSQFKKHPKWIIGFSDATVFHSHLQHNLGIASIHSKMCNSFPDDMTTADATQISSIESIQKILVGEKIIYPIAQSPYNKPGKGIGKLTGGNLSILQNLAGTHSDNVTKGKILFIEDVGEYLYSIDRMMWNLLRTGKLEELQGLIVGNFKIKPDEPGEEFGKSLYDIVLEKVSAFNYPVLFDFPVGHVKENYALKCGAVHMIEVNSLTSQLIEI